MSRRPINMNWLRTFEAAARHLSFTGAARELNMTQAGVSQQVRSLEQTLGQALFDRLPRSLLLTDAGEAYLRVVRESFDRLTAGTAEIFGEGGDGPLSVRCNVAVATLWLAGRLERFFARHPEVALRLTTAVHGLDQVWEGIDLEIRYGPEHPADFDAVALTEDRLFPVCAPALLAGAPPLRTPADLLQHRLLHVIGNRHGWATWFKAAGLQPVELPAGLQLDTSAVALALAANGLGVALGHSSLLQPYLERRQLVAPFSVSVPTTGAFYLVMPHGRPLRREAMLFRDWLLDEVERDRQQDARRRLGKANMRITQEA